MERSRRSGVQAIDRAVALLRCFTGEQTELGISQLGQLTGLSTSTTHRLLVALQAGGLVQQADNRRYRLGPLVLRLAHALHSRLDLRSAALPTMRQVRDETGETVGLHSLLPDLSRAVVDQVESPQPLRRTYTELGEPIPLNHGAPGKVLLAYLHEGQLEEVLARPLTPATPTTPVDADALRGQLAAIRERGYALSFAERVRAIHTAAAPIRDLGGHAAAALSITGPESRMPEERLHALGRRAVQAADQIGELLGD
ncbi:MAG: IclR family transcriptional regulator [Streptosporangiales bacterium]